MLISGLKGLINITKLRWTIRPFKTYTSKEYLQVFKNSFITVEAKSFV